MPQADSGSQSHQGRRRLWRVLCGVWSTVLLIAVFAPWPYAAGAALFATFVHFAALDERDDLQREAGS